MLIVLTGPAQGERYCLKDSKYFPHEILDHNALIRNLIKLKGTAKLTAQGEWVCLKDSKCILFEILAHRT